MPDKLGICVNSRDAVMPAWEQAALGLQWLRTIVYRDDDLDAMLSELAPGVQVIALLNAEHETVGTDWSGWGPAVGAFCERFAGRVAYLEAGNELDICGVLPEQVADLARQALAPCRAAGIKVILGSVAGTDWVNYLAETVSWLSIRERRTLAGAGFHPYGKAVEELAEACETAYAMAGRPIFLTEWGQSLKDAGSPEAQAVYTARGRQVLRGLRFVRVATQFCYSQGMSTGGDYGLRDADGIARPAWGAAVAAAVG